MSFTCEALTVAYDNVPVLQQFSLAFQPQKITALLGANGCGKSTLLKTLAGQLTPQAGLIQLDAKALTNWSLGERAQRVAYLPQYPELFADLTVFDLVRYGRYPMSWPSPWQL
jgi:iron complex transport system ATP-binding protein